MEFDKKTILELKVEFHHAANAAQN
jgi:hypothetical protein